MHLVPNSTKNFVDGGRKLSPPLHPLPGEGLKELSSDSGNLIGRVLIEGGNSSFTAFSLKRLHSAVLIAEEFTGDSEKISRYLTAENCITWNKFTQKRNISRLHIYFIVNLKQVKNKFSS